MDKLIQNAKIFCLQITLVGRGKIEVHTVVVSISVEENNVK